MQEVIFSRENTKLTYPSVFFNDTPVTCSTFQKYVEIYLHETLNFNKLIKEKIAKPIKGIGMKKRISDILFQSLFLTFMKHL